MCETQYLKLSVYLSELIIAHPTKPAKPYIYGFKTLTPVQSSLFDKTGYQVLESKQENTQSNNQVFQTTQDELLSAAHWAKDLNAQHPNKHIAIICPTLNNDHYQIQSVFDQVFADTLTETGQKSYNISLGFSLTEYPLIRHILTLLELCQQLQSNRIKTDTFNAVITSPYIAHAQKEQSARALLVNRTLNFSKTHFKFSHLEKHLNNTPQIKTLLETTILQATKRQQTHDAWLLDFNAYLQIWNHLRKPILQILGGTSGTHLSVCLCQLIKPRSGTLIFVGSTTLLICLLRLFSPTPKYT
jgi:hypothetical protein